MKLYQIFLPFATYAFHTTDTLVQLLDQHWLSSKEQGGRAIATLLFASQGL